MAAASQGNCALGFLHVRCHLPVRGRQHFPCQQKNPCFSITYGFRDKENPEMCKESLRLTISSTPPIPAIFTCYKPRRHPTRWRSSPDSCLSCGRLPPMRGSTVGKTRLFFCHRWQRSTVAKTLGCPLRPRRRTTLIGVIVAL